MKNSILIYVKNKNTKNFLEEFFGKHKKYTAKFLTNVNAARKLLKDSPPDLLIVEAPGCLDRLKYREKSPPILAITSDDIARSMRSILDNKVEQYVSAPFQKFDIECKLKILSEKDKYLDILTQELHDLRTLTQLSDFLSSSLDPQEILYMIVKKISESVPVSRCSILSVSFDGTKTAEVVSTFEDSKVERLTLELSKYPEITKALKTKRAVLIKDAQNDPIMEPVKKIITKLGIRSIAVVPIKFRNEIIGTLFLRTSRKKYEFSGREINLFQEIANTAGKALNNAFLFQQLSDQRSELEKLAITDFLTGIYNIRYLYHRLSTEFSRAERHKSKLSCLMIDIDFFKKINDTYGHRVGDMVLSEFAELLQGHTRKSDVFARYGGEEFIILLPHADSRGARSKAKAVLEAVREHKFKALKGKKALTVSIGVATYPNKKIKNHDDLITLADDALLIAKSKGRDCIVVS